MERLIADLHVRVSKAELAELHMIASRDLSPVTQVVRRMIRAGILMARQPTQSTGGVTYYQELQR